MADKGWGNNIFGSGYDPKKLGGGLSSILSGLFNDSSKPYDAAMDQYKDFLNQGKDAQNPFYNAGTNAIGGYQDWLGKMKDPSEFINHIMGQYQESPYARYQQNQNNREATNLGSASGLTGSTPLQLQAQQNSQGISSQDMMGWLQKVLGVNTEYGEGQNNLMKGGQNSANSITDLLSKYGENMGKAAYGQEAGKNNDFGNLLGGIGSIASMFF